jgi:hypothetical protein
MGKPRLGLLIEDFTITKKKVWRTVLELSISIVLTPIFYVPISLVLGKNKHASFLASEFLYLYG